MFYHQSLLAKKGPLGTIWIAGHSMSKKLTKRKVMETNIVVVCNDLEAHIRKFALPVRASLILGASIILQRKIAYLLQDTLDLKKKMHSSARTGRPVAIDMKEIPIEKAAAMLTLEVPRMLLGLNLDLDAFFEEEPPLTKEDFRRNMARPEDITMPGSAAIVDYRRKKKTQDQPLQDDFGGVGMEDTVVAVHPLEFDEPNMTALAETEMPNVDRSKVLPMMSEENLGAADLTFQPRTALSLTRLSETPRPVRSGRRGKGPKIDVITQLPKEQMKVQIADRTIGVKTRPKIDDVMRDIKQKNTEKLIFTTGDPNLSKVLQTARFDSYKTAVSVFKEQAAAAEEEDPFGWCEEGGIPLPTVMASVVQQEIGIQMTAPRGHSLMNQAEFFKDMPEQGTDDIYPAQYDMSAIHTHGISMDATVRSIWDQEGVGRPPAKKKMRRDLNNQEQAERICEAADFLETRYEKFHRQGEEVTFQRLMDGNSRKKAARCFAYLLTTIKDGKILVFQGEAYGPILMTKIAPNITL